MEEPIKGAKALDIYTQSKLKKISLLKINAEKLEAPSKDSELKIAIGIGLQFDDKKTDLGYEVTYNLSISCKQNGKEKLCKLDYKAMVTYEIEGEPKKASEKFRDKYALFVRENYHMSRDYLNDILSKMKVRFQLPISLPNDFTLKVEEVDEEK